jgi:hypothetical protein
MFMNTLANHAFAVALASSLTFAAGAVSAKTTTTTCAEFAAMSAEDQMAQVAMMHDEMMAPDDAMATDDAMTADDDMAMIMTACEGHPDMMVMDAMPTDDMAPATN